MDWIEIVGYTGSVLVAVSLTMNNIWRLRWINLFGAGTFAIYGLLTKTYPVFALNGFIVAIDVYYLYQMSREKDYFTLESVAADSLFLKKFLDYHAADIQSFFPGFSKALLANAECIFVLRNLLPVGVFAYTVDVPGHATILMDYVRPEYRDFKNAHFLYQQHSEVFNEKGIHTLVADSEVKAHQQYLRKLGFEADFSREIHFIKKL